MRAKVVYITAFIIGVSLVLSKGEFMKFEEAQKSAHRMEIHGDVRVDDYYWLRERDTRPVLDYLHQENQRTKVALASVASMEKELYDDIRSRIKENDDSVPVPDSGYFYYSRYRTGEEYPLHCRKHGSLTAPEEIFLDENEYARGHDYFDLASAEVTSDQNLLAFTVDYVGRRQYEILFKDLKTGRLLPDRISAVTPNLVWAEDGKTLFFVRQDSKTLRAFQVYRYEVGSEKKPELVYEEKDETFSVGLSASKTHGFLFIIAETGTRDASEWRILDAKNPKGAGEVFWPREAKHEYSLADGGDRFYILTNWAAKNFRLMEAPHTARSKAQWQEVLPHSPDVLRMSVDVNRDFLVIEELEQGLPRLLVLNRKTGDRRRLTFPDEAYDVSSIDLPDYSTQVLRFSYQSMSKPPAIFEENYANGERILRKQKEVPHFDPERYESRRLFISARDGTRIPVSLVMKKGTLLNGSNPLLLYGYGSYGYSLTHGFRSSTFSLVNRGFIYAQAHVRGGSEMGRDWYESGRLKNKLNSFHDFIDVAEGLIQA
jgi:oligopeptidase B